ncbi:hypothetical protein AUF78_08970 [archaeon 13_1_20CM_2_51_12]|nr:MAG: hypothetical protein AUF78_08970 [archaeon 13_1_20CM_2_51_12]
MDNLLILNLILAFTVGGAWVSFAILIAERYGSALGGLFGGLPAISIVSFLFIGLNQGPETASQATIVFPLALSFTMSFLVVYAVLSRRGFRVALLGALLVWAGLSVITALLNLRNLFFSVGVFVSVASFCFYMLKMRLKLPHVAGAEIAYSFREGAFRAIVGGSVIALAVLSSQIAGPELGGIASSFPAIFSLTLFFTFRTSGIDLSRALTKPLLVSAGLTAFPYSLLVGYLYPILGVGIGTIVALFCIVPLGALAHLLIDVKKI